MPTSMTVAPGFTEELLNVLTQVNGLDVAGRTSSFAFKGKNEDSGSIAQKLHVATLLEGAYVRPATGLGSPPS